MLEIGPSDTARSLPARKGLLGLRWPRSRYAGVQHTLWPYPPRVAQSERSTRLTSNRISPPSPATRASRPKRARRRSLGERLGLAIEPTARQANPCLRSSPCKARRLPGHGQATNAQDRGNRRCWSHVWSRAINRHWPASRTWTPPPNGAVDDAPTGRGYLDETVAKIGGRCLRTGVRRWR